MLNMIPAPQEFMPGEGIFAINATTQILASEGTENAAQWLTDGLARFAGIELGSGSGSTITLEIGTFEADIPATIGVRADGQGTDVERHTIDITANGVSIVGVSAEAVFRGATTILQLAALNKGALPIGSIVDSPRFAWRGLSLDVVRCFHPASTVKEVIDLLALYKMNVLHWHLTDSEGWRFSVDAWPKLTEVSGSTARNDRPGGFYSAEEFAELVRYAADRFVTVVPEFDTPGHTASVLRAYPDLADQSIHDMDEAMRYLHPDRPGVPDLLRDVYTAMGNATNGNYIHVGGDEAIAMEHTVFQDYIQMALPIARATGTQIVAWQEAARGGLVEGDLVQWWIPDALVQRIRNIRDTGGKFGHWDADNPIAKAFIELLANADQDVPLAIADGAKVIISPSSLLYLDTKYPELSVDPLQGEQHERVGMPVSVYENGTVQDAYDWDPLTVMDVITEQNVAGLEAAVWCEFIESRNDLFFQLLPRLAGAAEKGWSQQQPWDAYRQRLAAQPLFWDVMELDYFKSSVVW